MHGIHSILYNPLKLNLQPKLTLIDIVLVAYGNNKLKHIGSIDLDCSTKKNIVKICLNFLSLMSKLSQF